MTASTITFSSRFGKCPFPGLRAFEPDENDLFAGRDLQVAELLRRLSRHRFLAVVGVSGTGKSSLIRAGLIPALRSGYVTDAGPRWLTALLRPGKDPIAALVSSLQETFGKTDDPSFFEDCVEQLESSSLGLVEAVEKLQAEKNLLIVVDQFEELFRYGTFEEGLSQEDIDRSQPSDEASAFVQLLIQATRQQRIPIYVGITMRSDFIGDCARFRNLPEMLNEGQYLIPRMKDLEIEEAIRIPIDLSGAKVETGLVRRLISDLGEQERQLPILQHVLMRTWWRWSDEEKERHAKAQSSGGDYKPSPIKLSDYEAVGGFEKALDNHARAVYEQLSNDDRRTAKIIFQTITAKDSSNRRVRRPATLKDICAVIGAYDCEPGENIDQAGEKIRPKVTQIIQHFREQGTSFITSPDRDPDLKPTSVIDITHESLIYLWVGDEKEPGLRGWVDEEAESAEWYRRVSDASFLYQDKKGPPFSDPALQFVLKHFWSTEGKQLGEWNAAWAKRYERHDQTYQQVADFLRLSRKERDHRIAVEKAQEEANRENERRAHQAELKRREAELKNQELEAQRQQAELKRQEAELRTKEAEFQRRRHIRIGIVVAVLIFLLGFGLIYRSGLKRQLALYWAERSASQLRQPLASSLQESALLLLSSHNALSLPENSDLSAWETYSSLKVADTWPLKGSRTACTPDGSFCASIYDKNKISLWQRKSPDEPVDIPILLAGSSASELTNVAISDYGKFIVAGDSQGSLYVSASGKPFELRMKLGYRVSGVDISPSGDEKKDDGTLLVAAGTGETLNTEGGPGTQNPGTQNPGTQNPGAQNPGAQKYGVFIFPLNETGNPQSKSTPVNLQFSYVQPVRNVKFSPKGHYLLVQSQDFFSSSIDLIYLDGNKSSLAPVDSSPAPLRSTISPIAFSEREDCLAIGYPDSSTKVFNVLPTPRLKAIVRHAGAVRAIALDPTCQHLVTGSDTGSWDITLVRSEPDPNQQQQQPYESHQASPPIQFISYSRDGQYLAVAGGQDTKSASSPESANSPKATIPQEPANPPKQQSLNILQIYDSTALSPKRTALYQGVITQIMFVDDKTLFPESTRGIRYTTRTAVSELGLQPKLVSTLPLNAYFRTTALGNGRSIAQIIPAKDTNKVYLYDLLAPDANPQGAKKVSAAAIASKMSAEQAQWNLGTVMAINPGETALVATNKDGAIWICDGKSCRAIPSAKPEPDEKCKTKKPSDSASVSDTEKDPFTIVSLAISDKRRVAAGGSDGCVYLYDASDENAVKSFTIRVSPGQAITTVDLDKQGVWLGVGSVSGKVAVFSLPDSLTAITKEKELTPIADPMDMGGAISAAKFSADGDFLAAGSQHQETRILSRYSGWNADRAEKIWHSGTVQLLAFAPNSARLASATDHQVLVYDFRSGTFGSSSKLVAYLSEDRSIASVSFSQDANTLTVLSWKSGVQPVLIKAEHSLIPDEGITTEVCKLPSHKLDPTQYNPPRVPRFLIHLLGLAPKPCP